MLESQWVPHSQMFSGFSSQVLVESLYTFLFWWVCIPKANESFAASNVQLQIIPSTKEQGKKMLLKIKLNEKRRIIQHREYHWFDTRKS